MSSGENKRVWATRVVSAMTTALGSFSAMFAAALLVVLWLVSGPLFGFSDTWQLVINTTTTVITFLMCFVIQATQNRDNRAIQTKLDAILEASEDASNVLVGIEDEPEPVIRRHQKRVRSEATPEG
jgi:low affinity Fe/Cu permease